MAKTQLKPKCTDMLEQLAKRAEQQLREAFPLLEAQGRLHTYSARTSYGNQQHWDNCFGSYCIVLRFDENNELVYHDHAECWYPVRWCKQFSDLAKCADHLLNVAYGITD